MQKLYKALKLVNELIMTYVENYFHHWNHQPHSIKFSKVTLAPFFIPKFNLSSCELDNLHVQSVYIESFYVDIILKQNKTEIL